MRAVAAIALGIALCVSCAGLAFAGDPSPPGAPGSTQDSANPGDELHFVSVLTLNGEVVAVDRARLLVTLKGSQGTSTLEVRNEKDLEALKPGDHPVVRYFEGGQVTKQRVRGSVPLPSLKDGIVGAELGGLSMKHPLVGPVEGVDAANQEITFKGPDGSVETIMVTNPEHLTQIRVGDKVVITHTQALALSVERAR